MKKKKIAWFLTVVLAVSSFTGCGGNKPSETKTEDSSKVQAEVSENQEDGRYLVWRLSSEPKQWDPTNNSESISDGIVKQLFEGLLFLHLTVLSLVLQKAGTYQKMERPIHSTCAKMQNGRMEAM